MRSVAHLQAVDDRAGVLEVVDVVALDLRRLVGGDARLQLLLGGGLLGLAPGDRLLHPRRLDQRAEGDQRAGGPPALPRLRLVGERGAQGPDDHRVLLAHAQQHHLDRQLEGQVLEEEGEVEALVELDRDEHRLHRERPAARAVRGDRDAPAGAGQLARLQEGPPGVGGGVHGGRVDEAAEERVAQRLLGRQVEEELGRVAPLRQRALAVREHEEARDDLAQELVEQLVGGPGGARLGRGDVGGRVHLWRWVVTIAAGLEAPGRPPRSPDRSRAAQPWRASQSSSRTAAARESSARAARRRWPRCGS